MKEKKKKKRKYNTNLIKQRHSYALAEIALIYRVHIRTAQNWVKQGMKVIDASSKPYLVYGIDIKAFLKQQANKRKCPLKEDEFFCPKCKSARKSIRGKTTINITDRKLGKCNKLAFIRGLCEICRCRLIRFTSDKKLNETMQNTMLLSEFKTVLSGGECSSTNTDIEGGQNNESEYKKRKD